VRGLDGRKVRRFTEKDEHRTSNVQHRMMNKKTNLEHRVVIGEKYDEGKV